MIHKENPPYIFKLHIQAKNQGEITRSMVLDAIKKQCKFPIEDSQIEVRHFAPKNQFKVFVQLDEKAPAIKFFEKFFSMPQLPFFEK